MEITVQLKFHHLVQLMCRMRAENCFFASEQQTNTLYAFDFSTNELVDITNFFPNFDRINTIYSVPNIEFASNYPSERVIIELDKAK